MNISRCKALGPSDAHGSFHHSLHNSTSTYAHTRIRLPHNTLIWHLTPLMQIRFAIYLTIYNSYHDDSLQHDDTNERCNMKQRSGRKHPNSCRQDKHAGFHLMLPKPLFFIPKGESVLRDENCCSLTITTMQGRPKEVEQLMTIRKTVT